MSNTPVTSNINDFGQFAKLRASARDQDPAALQAAAKQFESLFTTMLLKTAHSGDSSGDLLGGPEADIYRDLYDQQLAVHLSAGRGLGIADLLIKQLQSAKAPGKGGATADGGFPLTAPAAPALPLDASRPAAAPASADSFVDAIQPHAEKAAAELGVPSRVLVAQAALETGWGQHVIKNADGSPSYNFFGIKADAGWQGAKVSKATQEFSNGVARTETAQFRSYSSPAEAFGDYVKFVKSNPRYAEALRHNGSGEQYVQGLQKAGYATDPAYAQKIANIAYGRTLKAALAEPAATTTRVA